MDIAISWSNGGELSLLIQENHDCDFYCYKFSIYRKHIWEKSRRLNNILILRGVASVIFKEDE